MQKFEKNANFSAENCQKSQKIVIITSTPDGWATPYCGATLHPMQDVAALRRTALKSFVV
jgi:hypothetical protein